MITEMVRNDPRMANNPMMRQFVETVSSNPAMAQQMAQQVAQASRNPAMMQRFQDMAAAAGGENGAGFTLPPTGMNNSGSNANPRAGSQQQQNNQSDQEMTEEEMLQEAIRRSLQDGQN